MIGKYIAIITDFINLKQGKTYDFYEDYNEYSSFRRYQHMLFKRYKDSPTFHRNIVAALWKQSRRKYSYRINEYWKRNEIEYEKYTKMDRALKSFESVLDLVNKGEDVYLVKFREGGYHPGERYAEYTSGTWGCWMDEDHSFTAKVKLPEDDNPDWLYLDTIKDNYGSISKSDWTTFRYATDEEIVKYKKDMKEYAKLNEKLRDMEIEHDKQRTKVYEEMEKYR